MYLQIPNLDEKTGNKISRAAGNVFVSVLVFVFGTNLVGWRALWVGGRQGDSLAGHWELNHLDTSTPGAAPWPAHLGHLCSPFQAFWPPFDDPSALEASSGNPRIPE